jgi:hypothetical protein
MATTSKTSMPMVNANVEKLRDQLEMARRAIREEALKEGWQKGYAAAIEDLRSASFTEGEIAKSEDEQPEESEKPQEAVVEGVVRKRNQIFAKGELQTRFLEAIRTSGEQGLSLPEFLINNHGIHRISVNHCVKRLLKQNRIIFDGDRYKMGTEAARYDDTVNAGQSTDETME